MTRDVPRILRRAGGPSPRDGARSSRHGYRRRARSIAWWGLLMVVAFSLTGRAPVAAGSDEIGPARNLVAARTAAQEEAARRLSWIVTLHDRAIWAAVDECVELGTTCPPDAILDVDSVRLQTGELAASLSGAIDPASPVFIGDAGEAATARARRTADAASLVSTGLGSWLASGCAGSVDEIVSVPPSRQPPSAPEACVAAAEEIHAGLRSLQRWIEGWPAP